MQCMSVLSGTPNAALDTVYTILKIKLENNPEQFQAAIVSFYKSIITMTSDAQLAEALQGFGQELKGT